MQPVSRKLEYGLRAMLFLAAQEEGRVVAFREVARRMDVPEDFLAKILKTLVRQKLLYSTRGPKGGFALAKPASSISFLDVIEAVQGPIQLNLCTDNHEACHFGEACTMWGIWRLGQERMMEVYRAAKLDKLAMRGFF